MKNIFLLILILTIPIQSWSNTKQGHWRWRADNGSDSTASFIAGLDKSLSLRGDSVLRLRIEKFNQGGPINNTQIVRFYYSKDEITWEPINRSDTNDFQLFNSSFINDSTPTNINYVGNNGTFQGGFLIDSSELFTETLNSESFSETEYCFRPTSNISDLQTYKFQIRKNDDTGLEYYLLPIPRLYTLFSASQAYDLSLSSYTDTSAIISWNKGSGDKRSVFLRLGDVTEDLPENDSYYIADTVFGNGNEIDSSGWYCVYNSTDTSVNISNLQLGEKYTARVFEYYSKSDGQAYVPDTSSENLLSFYVKYSQEISFSDLPEKNVGDADFDPGARSNRNLDITYSSDNESVASIINNMIHIAGAGAANITASQSGNDSIKAAEPVVKELIVSSASSVNSNISDKNIRIYPNPLKNGLLNITILEKEQVSKVTIFSVTGEKLISKILSSDQHSIQLDLPKGLYLLLIDSDKIHHSSKLIVE